MYSRCGFQVRSLSCQALRAWKCTLRCYEQCNAGGQGEGFIYQLVYRRLSLSGIRQKGIELPNFCSDSNCHGRCPRVILFLIVRQISEIVFSFSSILTPQGGGGLEPARTLLVRLPEAGKHHIEVFVPRTGFSLFHWFDQKSWGPFSLAKHHRYSSSVQKVVSVSLRDSYKAHITHLCWSRAAHVIPETCRLVYP